MCRRVPNHFTGMLKNWSLHQACNFWLYISLDLAYILSGFNSSFLSKCVSLALRSWSPDHPESHLKYMGIPIQVACLAFLWVERGRTDMVVWLWTPWDPLPAAWTQLLPSPGCWDVLSGESTDTACKRRTAADRCSDFSRRSKGLNWESQKLWELWRRGCPAVLSECR